MGLAAWHTLHYLHVPLTLSLVSRGLLAGTSIASPTSGSRWDVEIVVMAAIIASQVQKLGDRLPVIATVIGRHCIYLYFTTYCVCTGQAQYIRRRSGISLTTAPWRDND